MSEQESKPCELPCPMCGSTDINRCFTAIGSRIDGKEYGVRPSRYSQGQNYYWTAEIDHIMHHCRCCQYDWQTKPVRKPRKRKVASAA